MGRPIRFTRFKGYTDPRVEKLLCDICSSVHNAFGNVLLDIGTPGELLTYGEVAKLEAEPSIPKKVKIKVEVEWEGR